MTKKKNKEEEEKLIREPGIYGVTEKTKLFVGTGDGEVSYETRSYPVTEGEGVTIAYFCINAEIVIDDAGSDVYGVTFTYRTDGDGVEMYICKQKGQGLVMTGDALSFLDLLSTLEKLADKRWKEVSPRLNRSIKLLTTTTKKGKE